MTGPLGQRYSRLFAKPPYAIVLIGFAVCVSIALGWAVPQIFWGHWRGANWSSYAEGVGDAPLRPEDGVLLPLNQSINLASPCSRPAPPVVRRAWVPTVDQLRQLEADLPAMLRSIDDSIHRYPDERRTLLRDYRRQYAGLELETGERVIYVSGFHPGEMRFWLETGRDTAAWRREPIMVCDGGRGFWGVEYDPTGRRFRGFSFNDLA